MGLRSALVKLREALDQQPLRDSDELTEKAFVLAASDAEDEPARRGLEASLAAARPAAASLALERLASAAETSVSDRARRLLVAAIDREPVQPADPRRVELFEQLCELHALPVGDAFDRLAMLAPALRQLAEGVSPYPAEEHERFDWFRRETARAGRHVGRDASGAIPLLRTNAAHQVVLAYLRIAAGNTELGGFEATCEEIREARLREYERRGWTVERLPGGRTRISSRTA